MLTSSNAGSSETEENEFAVKPSGWPSSRVVVTIVTPVMKAPNASRSSRVLMGSVCWLTSNLRLHGCFMRLDLQPGTQGAIHLVGRGQVHHVPLVLDHHGCA